MLFRNPEVKKNIVIFIIQSLVLILSALFIDTKCSIFTLLCCIVFFIFYIQTTQKRYNSIKQLSNEIDILLQGNYSFTFKDCKEGELSILETQIQKLFGRLKEQNDNLKKEKLILSDSLADISHQIRTPLTSINLITSLLQKPTVTDSERLKLTNEMYFLLNATDTLLSTLLKIAKIDAGAIIFEQKECTVESIVKKCSKVLEISLEIKDINFISETNSSKINADFTWTSEAISNVLKNCIEHTPEKGTITLTAQETPLFTKITVTDTGNGFKEKDIPHLFERFYQGSNSSENNYGIGLNLAYMIITKQNGTMKASNKNGSACFEIKFHKTVI